MSVKKAFVCGAGGFIGSHLVKRLKQESFWVRGVDIKYPEFSPTVADDFILADLRDPQVCLSLFDQPFDEVYQLAADMGGAGYVFTGENDADIMANSALININILNACLKGKVGSVFYSSSACVYPRYNQMNPDSPVCSENSAYPADPDSDYGWEKLFSERLYLAFNRNYEIPVCTARYHNIFGPEGVWMNGREKAPAAICRKVAEAKDGGEIEIWGNGKQTRSFLFIDDCLEATVRLMRSGWTGPVNIGSEEMVSINELAGMVMDIAGKQLHLKHIPGPLGVKGRNSNNYLIEKKLKWTPSYSLKTGLEKTYRWIEKQIRNTRKTIKMDGNI